MMDDYEAQLPQLESHESSDEKETQPPTNEDIQMVEDSSDHENGFRGFVLVSCHFQCVFRLTISLRTSGSSRNLVWSKEVHLQRLESAALPSGREPLYFGGLFFVFILHLSYLLLWCYLMVVP